MGDTLLIIQGVCVQRLKSTGLAVKKTHKIVLQPQESGFKGSQLQSFLRPPDNFMFFFQPLDRLILTAEHFTFFGNPQKETKLLFQTKSRNVNLLESGSLATPPKH